MRCQGRRRALGQSHSRKSLWDRELEDEQVKRASTHGVRPDGTGLYRSWISKCTPPCRQTTVQARRIPANLEADCIAINASQVEQIGVMRRAFSLVERERASP